MSARSMQAIEISQPGGPEVLRLTERPVPQPAAGEVLIRVQAAGVNRPDVLQRKGAYAPPAGASDLPGLEVSGTIESGNVGNSGFKIGDEVCALVAGGGYAEFCVAPVAQCLPKPRALSFAEAAGLPETYFTVWSNVFDRARLVPGESLLVQGGSSGIGVAAIQLAAALGSTVFATAGSDEKCQACVELGAKRAINYRTEDFAEVIKTETDGRGVDVILDMVAGDYLPREIASLADDGRLVFIALLGGSKAHLGSERGSAPPVDGDRIDAASALGRFQGRDREAAARSGVAFDRVWAHQADAVSHLSAGAGGRRASADGIEPARGQDRADGRRRRGARKLKPRRSLVAANWKMNGSRASNDLWLNEFAAQKAALACDVVVCAPYLYLDQLRRALSPDEIGAQDVSAHQPGAYTGDVAAEMLRDAGCGWVIVGHSERRQWHGETDAIVAQKAERALQAGLRPIVCIGETLQQREAGQTHAVLSAQLAAVLQRIGAGRLGERCAGLRAGVGHRHRSHRNAGAGAGSARCLARAGQR